MALAIQVVADHLQVQEQAATEVPPPPAPLAGADEPDLTPGERIAAWLHATKETLSEVERWLRGTEGAMVTKEESGVLRRVAFALRDEFRDIVFGESSLLASYSRRAAVGAQLDEAEFRKRWRRLVVQELEPYCEFVGLYGDDELLATRAPAEVLEVMRQKSQRSAEIRDRFLHLIELAGAWVVELSNLMG